MGYIYVGNTSMFLAIQLYDCFNRSTKPFHLCRCKYFIYVSAYMQLLGKKVLNLLGGNLAKTVHHNGFLLRKRTYLRDFLILVYRKAKKHRGNHKVNLETNQTLPAHQRSHRWNLNESFLKLGSHVSTCRNPNSGTTPTKASMQTLSLHGDGRGRWITLIEETHQRPSVIFCTEARNSWMSNLPFVIASLILSFKRYIALI